MIHTHIHILCGGGEENGHTQVKTFTSEVTPSFRNFNYGYFGQPISRLTNPLDSFPSPPGRTFKKSFLILTASVTSQEPARPRWRTASFKDSRSWGGRGPACKDRKRLPRRRLPEGGGHTGHSRLSNTAVTRHRRPHRSRPLGIQASPPPAQLPVRPGLHDHPTSERRIPAHLSHIVLHLIQVSVFQGPHELLVAHDCSRVGRRAGQKWRSGPTRDTRK